MDISLLIVRVALAVIFGVAGIAKLLDLPGSRKAVADFGVPPRLVPGMGLALPLAELAIAVLLLPVSTARWGAAGALVLLLAFIVAITINLMRGRTPDCHCFGQLHSSPVGPGTLVRNGIMAVMAGFVLVAGWSDPGASLATPFRDLSGSEAMLLVLGLVLLGLVGGLAWVALQLMAQNGRILARLDELEGIATGDAPTPSDRGLRPAGGLAVGTPAPEFSLPDLTGTPVPLKSLLAGHRSVLLLFTDPACGPCRLVLPLVSQWQAAAGDRLHIEVISRGDHAANVAKAGEYGLRRVLLQADREISEAYATGGTPAAVLVGPDGTIAAPMAGGFDQIRDLVASLIGAEADSSLQPPAPPLTGLAPSFQLPNLAGREVSLDALLSLKHPVMLHFSAPQCGPCHALVPDIGGWQRHYHDRLTSVLISSGSPEHNRLTTSEYGVVPSLVLLQTEREVFDAFNMHQMPSALVIDPSGSIQSEPVYGVHAVRQLVADTLGLRLPDQPAAAVTLATVGEQAPVFRRPDLQGTPHDIGDSSAGETVLLFWNPGCPHCQELLPQLREWETHRDAPDILVVSRGPRALNRQLGLASPVVIDDDRTIFRSFGATGTPAAVVIDANGIVASPVGRGVTGVRDLIGGRIASNGKLQ